MFFTSRNRRLAENVERLKALEQSVIDLNRENKELVEIVSDRERAIKKIIAEKSLGFPWLANAIAEFYRFPDIEINNYLMTKKHPAYSSAEAVREVSAEKSVLRKQLKIAQNFVNYYETLFPWLTEYVGENLDELLESVKIEKSESNNETDPVLKYIPRAEYEKLPTVERNQKALDRYLASRKKPYEVGRDYERFIGYSYEIEGFKVEYTGIEKGLEDLGRDLICSKGDEIEIVQCKCWSSHKVIHEKHINQLYGTVVKYYIEHNQIKTGRDLNLFPDLVKAGTIRATFVTSTKLSDTAKQFATALGVKVVETKPLESYPLIKCNLGSSGEKIYHLPFDQQYDKTLIKNKGEFYAWTVKEAESKGFRRAFRWTGN